ncbi:adhesion G-protein coupled receptor G4 [Austrofundulus limnaeus]|uniref:Adhesion G-protein coupled receptor G4 n=1 Tax=Austrofundulus limnaeus TaxID=52670 RepID=A0A2I4AXD4_AUSLI|nr:PREDICTED: adhesion G-protein coupled receptor G4 [Austrofundulus limnaeus]
MNSMRGQLFFGVYFLIFESLCPLVSAASVGTSLWGDKLLFKGPPCLWQLHPKVLVPALSELSVCTLLKLTHGTEWTGFVYKAPGKHHIELGLRGTPTELTTWLFGKAYQVPMELKLNEWYTVCLTWSDRDQELRTYVDGLVLETHLAPGEGLQNRLAPNGTLTLGVSHFVSVNGELRPESGNKLLGEIGLFRMWGRKWRAEELIRQNCAEGDVLSWDLQQWKYDCPPEPDSSLHCGWSQYKIKLWAFMNDSTDPENCSVPLEEITRTWLESVLPKNISVQNIVVSSPRPTCLLGNNAAAFQAQQPQDLGESTLTCDKCFSFEVFVKVDPATDVKIVQTEVTALLSLSFSLNFLTITAVINSIYVLPVVTLSGTTEPPTAISMASFPPETSPTLSVLTQPMSTTGKPDLTFAVVNSYKFFRVNVTLSLTGSPTKPHAVIESWLKEKLQVNKTMNVLNLIITEDISRNTENNNSESTFYSHQKQYYCTFHVREYSNKDVAEIELLIRAALTKTYENDFFTIQPLKVTIKHIEPENCLEDDMSTIYGRYIWPETFPHDGQEMVCIKPITNRAYRLCKLDIETDTSYWADPDMSNCNQVLTISDITNITVTPDNAAEVVDMIQDLVDVQLGNGSQLSSSELGSVMDKLSEVVEISPIEPVIGGDIVNIVANILLSETDVTPVANNVLDLTDRMGNSMEFQGEIANLKAPALALSMIDVDPEEFSGLTFGVSLTNSMNPEVFVNHSFVKKPFPEVNATISLPSELNNFLPTGDKNTTRVQFQFYGTPDLFQDTYLANATQSNWTLNSYIVSASINNTHVVNLEKRVVVNLSHVNPKKPEDKVQCMFWDFQKYGGLGGWNSSGCETRSISSHQTSCLCDHLTHFAVLLDVSRTSISKTDNEILTVISYVGCGISSIFLGITLLTYLVFEKLRQDYPAKILINLSTALLGLSMLFLLDSWLSSFNSYGLCITTAASLHYFMLASFIWMGLEAVHMYLALVKVFNTYVSAYILKFCVAGWGIPLLIIILVLSIDKDVYGSLIPKDNAVALQSTEPFCWLQDDVVFFVTVVAVVVLILLGNLAVFIVVLIQIKRMRANNLSAKGRSSLQDLRAVVGLTILLGLTWSMGLFSFGPGRVAMMYMFSICNSLQGFFVFLFHCLMKENVRKQWRTYLCCGHFRLTDNSDWSLSATVCGRSEKGNLINSDSVASENTSSLRSSTLPQNPHHSTTRGQD